MDGGRCRALRGRRDEPLSTHEYTVNGVTTRDDGYGWPPAVIANPNRVKLSASSPTTAPSLGGYSEVSWSGSVIYLSGAMRGIPDLNYPAFNKAAKTLRDRGLQVINPAELSGPEDDTETAIREDFMCLAVHATAIAFIPGWHGSEGARAEYLMARTLGLGAMVMSTDLESVAWEGSFSEMSDGHMTPIDDEAWRLVWGDRGQSYGNPSGDFTRTAEMWSQLLGDPDVDLELGPLDIARSMIALKLSRLTHKPTHWDSITDIIGYALCMARIIRDE